MNNLCQIQRLLRSRKIRCVRRIRPYIKRILRVRLSQLDRSAVLLLRLGLNRRFPVTVRKDIGHCSRSRPADGLFFLFGWLLCLFLMQEGKQRLMFLYRSGSCFLNLRFIVIIVIVAFIDLFGR